ncbi:MAG TPA: FtsQ-type POTRA domain-containing protein [Candidatus Limnocylindrales bacterium]|nr:FtsQ-type POTRA domain-containing protein [Candidatus Limnocylindrales bacterium]
MTARSSVRTVGHVRRRSAKVRRRTPRLTAARAGGILAMLVAAGGLYGLATSPVFGLERLVVEGAELTDDAAIRGMVDLPAGEPLVVLRTDSLAASLRTLPAVADAQLQVGLPGTVTIRVTERRPIAAWRVDERLFLVDVDGRVIAEGSPDAALPRLAAADGGGPVPVIVDGRPAAGIRVGATLNPVVLDAARRLGSLVPTDAGTEAPRLAVAFDEAAGWIVRPDGDPALGWTAIFGFYTSDLASDLRPTSMIPAQVRLLRSLLDGREAEVGRVILASGTEGTYVPREAPQPSPSPVP